MSEPVTQPLSPTSSVALDTGRRHSIVLNIRPRTPPTPPSPRIINVQPAGHSPKAALAKYTSPSINPNLHINVTDEQNHVRAAVTPRPPRLTRYIPAVSVGILALIGVIIGSAFLTESSPTSRAHKRGQITLYVSLGVLAASLITGCTQKHFQNKKTPRKG